MEINKTYLGNCLDIMSNVPDKFIDFICTDLPYEQTASEWDKQIDINSLWQYYNRIIKPTGTIALFASQPFTTKLINSNIKNFRYCWYWIKNQGTNFFHAKSMPIRKIEEIIIFNKGKYYPQHSTGHIPTNSAKGCSNGKTYHGTNKRNYTGGKTTRFPTNILEFKCVDNYSRKHSQEKPVNLLEYLIRTYTDENDIVLDSCCGSGSIGVACKNTNRNYIMIDNNPDFVRITKERLNEEVYV